jgi:uncharacterized membrane protein
MSAGLFALTLAAALGSGLLAGVFYAFSSFVMPALARLDPALGTAAMQSINVEAPRPAFMAGFAGTALLSIAAIVAGLVTLGDEAAPWLLAGGALYLVGTFGLTIGYHVPRNNALARAEAGSAAGNAVWSRYLSEWTRGNHVRGLAALAASAAFIVALTVTA